jgi:hypothetical protein
VTFDKLRKLRLTDDEQRVLRAVSSILRRLDATSPATREGARWEYRTERKSCPQVGVPVASTATSPGDGWELVSVAIGGDAFWYFWKRRLDAGNEGGGS